jgi:hypothetical protein
MLSQIGSTHNLNLRRSRFALARLPRRSMNQIAQRKMTKPPASRTTSVKVSSVILVTIDLVDFKNKGQRLDMYRGIFHKMAGDISRRRRSQVLGVGVASIK